MISFWQRFYAQLTVAVSALYNILNWKCMLALQISLSKTSIEHQMKTKIAYLYPSCRCKIQRYGIWLMGDDIGTDSVTDCHLRSFSDHRRHTQQCRAAPWQKPRQAQPEPMSSPINYPAYFFPHFFLFLSYSQIQIMKTRISKLQS